MQLADKILIVTKQTEYAVKATNELIQNVNRNNSDKYIFLCNDFKKEEENALLLPTAAHRFTVSEYIVGNERIGTACPDAGIAESGIFDHVKRKINTKTI